VADEKDRLIFITGIVGRAMGSGKFGPDDIKDLAVAASTAFFETFGDTVVVPILTKAYDGPPVKTYAPENMGGDDEPAEVDGKPFRMWGGDKIRLGKKDSPIRGKAWGEITWGEAHQLLVRGTAGESSKTKGYLKFLSELETKDQKYAKSDETMRQRARSVLDSVGPAQTSGGGGGMEDTPFARLP